MQVTPQSNLVYNYFPKYTMLENMTMAAFSGSNADTVNVYLDINKMVNSLYAPNVKILYPLEIAAVLINLCAHYRTFYRVYHKVETNFFLVYSDLMNEYGNSLVPGYNSSNIRRVVNKVTTDAIEISMAALAELCPYLPNIYFKRDIYEPMVVIYKIIEDEKKAGNTNPNIIITKEPLCYQVLGFEDDTAIFIDDKKAETCYAITRPNVNVSYFTMATNRDKIKGDCFFVFKLDFISPELLGLLISITNLPSRDLKSIMSANKAINTIYGLIEREELANQYSGIITYLYNKIFNGLNSTSLETFKLRFKAVDLNQNYLYYSNTPYGSDLSYKSDLQDPETVQAINNQYFKDTPIDLNRL